MHLNDLTALSPVDGRYRNKVSELAPYLSEFGLIRYRVLVEIEYLIFLAKTEVKPFEGAKLPEEALRSIYQQFTEEDALWIKETEKTTNHDVKAVEYFVKNALDQFGMGAYKEMVHFGLTSQDINNTAIPLSMKDALENGLYPAIDAVMNRLQEQAAQWKDIPMLARTHGQPASPTRLGKEMEVFLVRLAGQYKVLKSIPFKGKFGGATGNMNAHFVAYPNQDWHQFASAFLNSLGLQRSFPTTQIDHYDTLAAQLDAMRRLNVILIDYSRDIWTYVSMEYFRQKIKAGEIGSSAMPHKVNPIDFENAEGNLGIANALLGHMAEKLPISRLQRDLTDSTVLRNLGVPLAHMLIALKSICKGMDKLLLNEDKLRSELNENWAVVAEAIQTVLRRESYPQPYETLKELTRTHEAMTRERVHAFIDTLQVSGKVREELKAIQPDNYLGR